MLEEEMQKGNVEDLGDGIYKLISPVRINRSVWVKDKKNSDLMLLGTNYSDDYEYCDILYLTKSNYILLHNMCIKMAECNDSDGFGTSQCLYGEYNRYGAYYTH